MSNNNNQKVRRNVVSPSIRQGPLRATQQFALVGGTGSPARKHISKTHTSSPTSKSQAAKTVKARSHSETGFVSERRSPTPSISSCKVEKPKALRAAGSVDNISFYLSGQWPKDGCAKYKGAHDVNVVASGTNTPIGFTGVTNTPIGCSFIQSNLRCSPLTSFDNQDIFIKDQHTQTSEDWEDDLKKPTGTCSKGFVPYKRSKSVGTNENWLKSKDIKARLQRKDNSGRSGQTTAQRFSPVPILTNSLSPRASASQPIKIPVPIHENGMLRGTPGKARASVEGLNPEIEKLIISATSVLNREEESGTCGPMHLYEHPDGHRAPGPESLNFIHANTQTPSQSDSFLGGDSLLESTLCDHYSGGLRTISRASTDTESASSRPQSISPSPFLLGPLDIDEPTSDTATSPRPNSAGFVRLPPDGAEKLKIVTEISSLPPMKAIITPITAIKLQPSETSAFSSLSSKRASLDLPSVCPSVATRFVEEGH